MSTKGSSGLPNYNGPLEMTQNQYNSHKREYEEIERQLLRLAEERQFADFHLDVENGIPDAHQIDIERREGILNDRKLVLRNILTRAVVTTKKALKGVVGVGSKVLLQTDEDQFEVTLVSVSPDVFKGEVSLSSPIGAAINGRKEGASIEYAVEGNVFHGKILKVT